MAPAAVAAEEGAGQEQGQLQQHEQEPIPLLPSPLVLPQKEQGQRQEAPPMTPPPDAEETGLVTPLQVRSCLSGCGGEGYERFLLTLCFC